VFQDYKTSDGEISAVIDSKCLVQHTAEAINRLLLEAVFVRLAVPLVLRTKHRNTTLARAFKRRWLTLHDIHAFLATTTNAAL
jgi:hypothetical protein